MLDFPLEHEGQSVATMGAALANKERPVPLAAELQDHSDHEVLVGHNQLRGKLARLRRVGAARTQIAVEPGLAVVQLGLLHLTV